MLVEQERYEEEISVKKLEEAMLLRFQEMCIVGGIEGGVIQEDQEKEKLNVLNRIEKENFYVKQRLDYFDLKHDETRATSTTKEAERSSQWQV